METHGALREHVIDLSPRHRDEYDGQWVVSALLEDRAERFPDRVAIATADGQITYEALCAAVARLAGGLIELGVQPGDRVATMLDATPAYVEAWNAIAWAGGVDVPVNTAYKGPFLERVLAQSGASIAVVHARWVERLAQLELPELRHVVVLGEDPRVPCDLELHAFASLRAGRSAARVPRDESDLAYILYTSGTTGLSKGVMLPNRTALFNTKFSTRAATVTAEDVSYSFFPLFHVTGRSVGVTGAFWHGGTVFIRPGFSRSEFWEDVRRAGATWTTFMGAVVHFLHAAERRGDDADNPLRALVGAGAPPPIIGDFEERFGVELIEGYGMTETGGICAAPRVHRGTSGPPYPHVSVEIHDDQDHALPTGVPGEIVVRPLVANAIFSGYWAEPEATLEAFRNLWFHTGDMGYFDEQGRIVFVDRLKDSIRRRGENISSFELESALQKHPAVAEVAAFAVPAESAGDEVMIAVVLEPDGVLDAADFFEFSARTVPYFAVPRYVRIVDALPRTPSQRVQKYLLRDEGITADTLDREALDIVVTRE